MMFFSSTHSYINFLFVTLVGVLVDSLVKHHFLQLPFPENYCVYKKKIKGNQYKNQYKKIKKGIYVQTFFKQVFATLGWECSLLDGRPVSKFPV